MKNNYRIIGEKVFIELLDRKGIVRYSVIDIDEFERISHYGGTFFASYRKKIDGYYACTTLYLGTHNGKPTYKTEYLHRIILNENRRNVRIDHIDYDTLNNTKKNLRLSTAITNSSNRSRKNSNNTSGYRNVSWINGYWRIQLQVEGKNKLFSEKFDDVHEAGKFAKEMRQKYYGNYSGNE